MDAAYEYDAPQFYDFKREDDGTSMASKWFDGRDEDALMRSPLAELPHDNQATSKAQFEPAAGAHGKGSEVMGLISNIVTSWGGAAAGSKGQAAKPGKPGRTVSKAPAQEPAAAAVHAGRPGPSACRVDQENRAPGTGAAPRHVPATTGKVAVKPASTPGCQRARREEARPVPQAAVGAQGAGSRASPSAAAAEPRQQSAVKQARKAWQQQPEDEAPAAPPHAAEDQPRQQSAAKKPRKAWQQPAVEVPVAARLAAAEPTTAARLRRHSGRAGWTMPLHAVTPGRRASGMHLASALCQRAAGRRLSQARQARAAAAHAQQGGDAGATPAVRRGVAAAKLKKVLRTHKVLPARSTKALTLPDDVELHTSKRARTHCDTEPEPQGTPFKALALKVEEFQKKTPARFRTKPAPPPEHAPLSITEPQAPLLYTSARTRPSHLKSSEQQELEELEAMPKFHALKLNTSALQGSGQLKFERPAEGPRVTEPQPFVFVTDDRASRRRKREACDQEQPPAFKAQPLDRSILEGPVGFPPRPRRFSCTVPKSPLLHTKLRSQEAPPLGLDDFHKQEFKARPVPQYLSVPREFRAPEPAAAPTQPRPFNLRTESRGRHYQQELQARKEAAEAAARDARIPRAQLLPLSLEVPMVPPRPEPRALTLPRPFNLRSEVRHQEYQGQLLRERQEEEVARAEAQFKARPLPALDQVFQVHESHAALTVPVEPRFQTESRAADRAQFDDAVQEKMRLMEEQRQAQEALRQAEEERTVRELRRGLVVPARAVPDFSRPFMALPSERALTNPITPKLGRKKNKRSREQAME